MQPGALKRILDGDSVSPSHDIAERLCLDGMRMPIEHPRVAELYERLLDCAEFRRALDTSLPWASVGALDQQMRVSVDGGADLHVRVADTTFWQAPGYHLLTYVPTDDDRQRYLATVRQLALNANAFAQVTGIGSV